jgi:outer membrane protein assembly factor BamB
MKTSLLLRIFLITTISFGFLTSKAQQDNWTHFRGSNLNGIATETKAPTVWNDSTNIMWKTDIAGKGWSSPVVYGNQIWVTTATDNGRKMLGICLDINSGKKLYELDLFHPDSVFSKHAMNSYATPTCAIEKGFVYIHFGSYGTACVNTATGATVWKRTDLKCAHVQGPGASPIIYKDLLILNYEGTDVQFLIALDKKTGKTIWKTDRSAEFNKPLDAIGRKAYITPIVLNVKGVDLLISNGSAVCNAYEVATGKEVWHIVKGLDSSVAMPFEENGTIYYYTSFLTQSAADRYIELLSVNPDGKGDIAKSNVNWIIKSPPFQLSTPVIKDGLIYTIDASNTLSCLDAKTGKELYNKKLKSKFHSSPILANGNVYFNSVKGETLVIKQGKELQVVAENKLPGEVYATPAFVRNSIIFRNEKSVYRIADK